MGQVAAMQGGTEGQEIIHVKSVNTLRIPRPQLGLNFIFRRKVGVAGEEAVLSH